MKFDLQEDCVKYFKCNDAYKRLFQAMRRQWKKYGRIAGWIIITKVTDSEKMAFQAILGRYFAGDEVKFKMSDFQKALRETKYASIELPDLIAGYFDEILLTNQIVREQVQMAKQVFFSSVIQSLKQAGDYTDIVAEWLDYFWNEKSAGYQLFMTEYEKKPLAAKKMLIYVVQTVNYLAHCDASSKIRLAVLAALITGNPHYFDRSQSAGRLLLYALSYTSRMAYPKDAECVLEVYFVAGIRSDDISSFTTAYGISLYTPKGIHPAYEGFIRESEAYMINLAGLEHIVQARISGEIVFVVENQMVFSALCESIKETQIAMICTSGQMKTASLILIDLLCAAGCRLYYSGDIDPEGILIADRILKRHPQQIIPWHFTITDYGACCSEEVISAERLKKLQNVEHEGLKKLSAEVLLRKKAGYQEILLGKLRDDIISFVNDK